MKRCQQIVVTEIIEHIDSLLKEDCSRLEIIESLISEFGSDYPDYDYTKWREIVKARIEETAENEEEDTPIYIPQINVVSIKEKYDRAQKQANYLLGWLEKKGEPIQTWSTSTTNRWARIYLECQSVLASMDDDFSFNMISDELYLTCKSLLEKVGAIYATIPQDKLLKSSLSINQKAVLTKLSNWRTFKRQLQHIQFPINIQRRIAVDMPLNREDIHNYVLLAAEEKDKYSYSDLFIEQMSRMSPLLDSEEYEYFKRYREGDISARDAIIEALMPTLIARIKAYCYNHCEFLFDDLLQDSILTVLEAFEYYHISRYSSFKSYAIACVNYSINTNASRLCPLKTKHPRKSDYTFNYDPFASNTYWWCENIENDNTSKLDHTTNKNNCLFTINDEINVEQIQNPQNKICIYGNARQLLRKKTIEGVTYNFIHENQTVRVIDCDISSVIIPEYIILNGVAYKVTSISLPLFKRSCLLKEITLPNTILNIEQYTFQNQYNLTSIVLPNSLDKIEHSMFLDCKSLTSIIIPNIVKSIGGHAFERCLSLEECIISSEVEVIDHYAFSQCKSLKKLLLPSSLAHIGARVFEGCSALSEIEIPCNVRTLGNCVFQGCTSLKQVKLPGALKKVGVELFNDCNALNEILIPEGTTEYYCKGGLEPYRHLLYET